MSHGVCIKCGLPPVPGHRYCEECAPARNPTATTYYAPARNPTATPYYEPVCSEECHATCLGRIARIEDDVLHILERMKGHDGQLVELLRSLAERKPE